MITLVGLFCRKHRCCWLTQPKPQPKRFSFIVSQLLSARKLQVPDWCTITHLCSLLGNYNSEVLTLQALRGGARSSIVRSSFQYTGMTSSDLGCRQRGCSGLSTSHTDRPDRNLTKMYLRRQHQVKNVRLR